MKWWVFPVVSLLAACATATPPKPTITLIPDATGLAVAPSGLRIDFGRSPEGVVPLLDQNLGAHETLPLTGCPASVQQNLRWGNLVLTFTDEQFVGWRQNAQALGRVCTP